MVDNIIFVPLKVPSFENFDDVSASDFRFASPLIINPGYAYEVLDDLPFIFNLASLKLDHFDKPNQISFKWFW